MHAVSAKFVYNTDLDVFNNPSEETDRFIDGVCLLLECIGKMSTELPLYRIYPNKLYRDTEKALSVIKIILLTLAACAAARVTVFCLFSLSILCPPLAIGRLKCYLTVLHVL